MPMEFTWFSPKSNSANCRNRLYSCGFTLSKRQPLHLKTFKSCTEGRKPISYGKFRAPGKFAKLGKSIRFLIKARQRSTDDFLPGHLLAHPAASHQWDYHSNPGFSICWDSGTGGALIQWSSCLPNWVFSVPRERNGTI